MQIHKPDAGPGLPNLAIVKTGPSNAAPGSIITYTITYTNVASANVAGNPNLTASNVVITENGSAGTNNWASFTDYVLNSAVDPGGVIGGNAAGSTVLTDTVASVAPQGTGTFKFVVKIR